MDARSEAQVRVGGEYDVTVLEPSPPAIAEPPWFADDPCLGDGGGDRPLVTPIDGLGDLSWNDLCKERPELHDFCAERWLGSWPRLRSLPYGWRDTLGSLHALAEHVLAAARYRDNGKIGLRFTRRGFGTPFFGADQQIRVEAGRLVVNDVFHEPVSLAEAAELSGLDAPGLPDVVYTPSTSVDTPLVIAAKAAEALGAWYGFAWSVLEQLRFNARDHQPGRVQLWPEHFDPSIELGSEQAGQRASFGASSGDESHPEPYLYVSPWVKHDDPFWNDASFQGAALPYEALLAAPDQRAAALEFFAEGLAHNAR